jgi:hypothetical protein
MFDQESCTLDEFVKFVSIAGTDYRDYKNKSTESMLSDYQMLKHFNINQIYLAYNMHRQNPKDGMYSPTPAHLMNYLETPPPTTGQIIAAARLKKTPLGVLAAIKIGSYDLANMNSYDLRDRAEEVLQLLPEWKNLFNQNKISKTTLKTFEKFGVSPGSHFQNLGQQKPAEMIELFPERKQLESKPRLKVISDLAKQKRVSTDRR